MEYRVLLRHKVKVYGDTFHVELREHPKWDGASWFSLVNVYPQCEHDRGIPYHSLDDALHSFEDACGVSLSEELRAFLGKR